MNDIAIRVENLSKLYRIGLSQGGAYRYKALRDVLTDAMYAPFRYLRSTFKRSNVQRSNDNYIWALKDVYFEVKRGEVVGIIGRNGAGKTTLLKILSRITEPTEGYAEVRGRVGSLLEVGTGFHPELTGRENIYLNGAILGMKKREIDRKFDEIVDFAEVEKFIDTPVKHYSSGMYVRLAFSVAAHLEPEILLVDEVLAVGDAAFQKKCLGKMGDVAKEGRTVLFVSHNLDQIMRIADRGIILDYGSLIFNGDINNAVQVYISQMDGFSSVTNSDPMHPFKISQFVVEAIESAIITSTSRLRIFISYETNKLLNNLQIIIGIRDSKARGLLAISSHLSDLPKCLPAKGTIICETDPLRLTPGYCYINIAIWSKNILLLHIEKIREFIVHPDDLTSYSALTRQFFDGVLPSIWRVHET